MLVALATVSVAISSPVFTSPHWSPEAKQLSVEHHTIWLGGGKDGGKNDLLT